MRATIKMIAEKAGVSIGTVDRVLHDRPYVKEEVRTRILQVMEELDYHPNRMASALATSGTPRRLAVIQPEWKVYIGDAVGAGVTRFREEHRDYNVSVNVRTYPPEGEACLKILDEEVGNGAQAVALCASDSRETREKLAELADRHIPVVTFNSDIPTAPRLCYVGEDAHHAGRVAGEIAAKFLRPGDPLLLVYAGPAYAGHKARADGFLERLADLGFRREDCRIAATHDDYDETLRAVEAALAEDPDLAYIYMANFSVTACVEAIRRQGRTGRVRVLSHDNGPDIQRFLKEGLVDFTIGQDLAYQSYQALSVLFRALTEHKLPERDCFYSDSPILNAETL
ncbi:substrate-binding domain-containing protein [uncultured Dysosmobacter sp.]|uniref:LacI family DNA-binding transcriptional regulator n=1 Tax=uncultured Dysosmobacter sp. TaxID=2591384 RepID=UPI00261725A9|nr:substrate-binding domain-containing protein [uncultured Dysosmobacter sp.]